MIELIIALVVIGLVCWILWWFVDYIALPTPFNKVAKVLIALVAVVALIRILMRFAPGTFNL